MYALNVTSRKQLERATLRAQAEKLRFEEVVFGIYKVRGSKGDKYLVGIEANPIAGYDICCSCPTQAPDYCKHVSTVFPHFLMRESEFKAEEIRMTVVCTCGRHGFAFFENRWWCGPCLQDEQARRELACKDCGGPATSGEGRCDDCQMAKDSEDLFGTPSRPAKRELAPLLPFVRRERVKEEW